LDGIIRCKRENATAFAKRLRQIRGVTPPVERPDRGHVYLLYTTLLDSGRDRVLDAMLAARIEARLYFPPAHRQPIFAQVHAELPVTEDLSHRMLSLPFHSRLSPEQFEEVAATLETALDALGSSNSGRLAGIS
jgi:perosamine synthetase